MLNARKNDQFAIDYFNLSSIVLMLLVIKKASKSAIVIWGEGWLRLWLRLQLHRQLQNQLNHRIVTKGQIPYAQTQSNTWEEQNRSLISMTKWGAQGRLHGYTTTHFIYLYIFFCVCLQADVPKTELLFLSHVITRQKLVFLWY